MSTNSILRGVAGLGACRGLWLVLAVTAGLAGQANAQGRDHVGTRSASLGGATRAIGTSNDAIFLNAAAMVLRQRYELEGSYTHLWGTNLDMGVVSIVDSRTNPKLAGGLAVSYTGVGESATERKGAMIDLALAVPLGEFLALGLNGHWVSMDGLAIDDVDGITMDVSLAIRPAPNFHIGLSGYNLISVKEPEILPRSAAWGLAYVDENLLSVGADMTIEFDRYDEVSFGYQGGAEFVVPISDTHVMPLRVGYLYDTRQGSGQGPMQWLTAGLGYVSMLGGIDVAYRESLLDSVNRELSFSLKLYL